MNTMIFINEAIQEGITNYLNHTNENDFITIIIKTLIAIYGELDIIHPYRTKTESGLGGFDENICKFGYSKDDLSLFKQHVLDFYQTKDTKPNPNFNKIEMELIDLFFMKMKNGTKENFDDQEFLSFIQFENTPLNQMYSTNKDEIKKYYTFKKSQYMNKVEYKRIKVSKLTKEAYEMAGISLDKLDKMNDQELLDANNKVFEYFNIQSSSEEKYIRLEQAISYYKEFPDLKVKKDSNGYIEFLLLSGFIAVSLVVILTIVGVLIR